jgi:type III pantothenate kinase
MMQASLSNNTAQLPLAERANTEMGFGINTNDAIIGGCDAAQIGAIFQAIQIAKKMNHPVEKIWLDGGNAKVLAQAMMKSEIPGSFAIETIEGLVLRGTWAWLLQNL